MGHPPAKGVRSVPANRATAIVRWLDGAGKDRLEALDTSGLISSCDEPIKTIS